MKTLTKNTLLLTCSLLLLSASCKKTKTGLAALPPATQEGKNTFGCLINGKAFVAQSKPFTTPPVPAVTCKYGYIDDDISKGHNFSLYGSDNKVLQKPDAPSAVLLCVNKIDIQEGATYQLKDQKDNGAYADYHTYLLIHDYTSLTGELTITKFDEINGIASGTFWFDTKNEQGEKIEIRDGRFDAKINQ
ncbi:MAG: hypothetical protein WBP45_14355 [Daejeonella sp.]